MMDVELTQTENGTEIYAAADTGNKQWVAIITDTHPKYNYEREFVAYQKPKTSKRFDGRAMLEAGDVVESVRYTHSGKNDSRTYYQFVAGELHEIEKTDVTKALSEIVVDVAVPRDVEFDDLESCVTERHECEHAECDRVFDSAHGAAVHAGLVHSDGDDEPSVESDGGRAVLADGGEIADENGFTIEDYPKIAEGKEKIVGLNEWGAWYFDPVMNRVHNYKREQAKDEVEERRTPMSETMPACEELHGEDLVGFIRGLDTIADYGQELINESDTVRSWRDVEHTPEEVRHYSADGHLYAYRSGDGEEHIVVSRGRNPGDKWTKHVPATRTAVVEGEKLWTIPDNWEHLATVGEVGVDGLYYDYYHIPETDVDVSVAYGTRDHVCDCWYHVRTVGEFELDVTSEVDTAALAALDPEDERFDHLHSGQLSDEARTVLGRISDYPDVFAKKWRAEFDRFLAEAWENAYNGNEREYGPFDPDGVDIWGDVVGIEPLLEDSYNLSRDDAQALDIVLRDVAVPSYPRVRPRVTAVEQSDGYYIRALTQAGCSPAEAVDYLMVEIVGESQTGWAKEAGKKQPSVSKNVRNAKRVLNE